MRFFLMLLQVCLLIVFLAFIINYYLEGNNELFALTELLIIPSFLIFVLQFFLLVKKPSIDTRVNEIIMALLPFLLAMLLFKYY